jgi:hypothetical protein
MRHLRHSLIGVCLIFTAALARAATAAPDAAQLRTLAARFAPVEIRVDLSAFPATERRALVAMIRAAKISDAIYLQQVSPLNASRLADLANDATPLGAARLRYFLINKGPWSELDENRPFLPGVELRPPQANLYPADATRAEVQSWVDNLRTDEHEAAVGFFTAIRRNAQGSLTAVPYSLEYQGELTEMARLLREAAALTAQPTLAAYLEKRAAAFLSNDYYDSDIAWMDLDATIEPTIGPYEVYEDHWFHFKAFFESFIAITDPAESKKLGRFSAELQGLEDHLPIDPTYRQSKLGGHAPIRVVNVVYTGGDGNHGVQAGAFNLPNDERVVASKGSKRTMLKNFQLAKYEKVLLPIAAVALSPADRSVVAFDPFFTHILMHELMHGLGPKAIRVGDRETTVSQELKEFSSPLEEAKADVSGLWALQRLMDKGVLDKKQERSTYITFLASAFRSLRFGLTEAHAQGMALQVNNLLDHGAIVIDSEGRFSLDVARTKRAVTDLTHQIMTLQAHGDYAAVQELSARMMVIRPQVKRLIDRMTGLPVDIEPRLATAEELLDAEAVISQ